MNQPSTSEHPAAGLTAAASRASQTPQARQPRHWIPELPLRPNPDHLAADDRVTGRMSNE